jgi:hypothetical protein
MRLQLTSAKWRVARSRAAASACLTLAAASPAAEPSGATSSPVRAQSSAIDVKTQAEVGAYTDSDNVSVLTPSVAVSATNPTAGYSVSATYLTDIVTAASVDIVSTATPRWSEVRQAATLQGTYQPKALGVTASAAVSSEPDYLSMTGGGALRLELDHKRLLLGAGYAFSRDEAGRSGTPFSVYSLLLHRHILQASLGIVLDRSNELTFILDSSLEYGNQEKPYRYLALFTASAAETIPNGAGIDQINALRLPGRVAERLPETRQRYAFTTRLGSRGAHRTFIALERLYADSWGLMATTTDLRYVFDLGSRFDIHPDLRVHLQSGASFWRRAYVGSVSSGVIEVPEYRAGDRELGPLLSETVGLGADWLLGSPARNPWILGAAFEETHTSYFDALFISKRYAEFVALTLEKTF